MNIFKLTFTNKEAALADLTAKGILMPTQEEGFTYGEGVHAVVEIGVIALDENTNAEGYHYDIMSDLEYDFGLNLVTPLNPKHTFGGYEI
jgi:hypothetical protein